MDAEDSSDQIPATEDLEAPGDGAESEGPEAAPISCEPSRGLSGERILSLFLRLLVLTVLVLIPLIFYVGTKRNFSFPKFLTLRYLALLALVVWIGKPKKPREWRSPARFPWLVYLLGALLSTLAATNMAESFEIHQLPDIVAFFVLFHITYHLAHSVRFIHLGTSILASVTLMVAIYGTLQNLGLDKGVFTHLGLQEIYFAIPGRQPVSSMGNMSFLGAFLICTVPLCAALLLSARRVFGAIVPGLAVLFGVWCLFAAGAGAAWFGLWWGIGLAVPIMLWAWRERAGRHLLCLGVGCAALGSIQLLHDWWHRSLGFFLALRYPDWFAPPVTSSRWAHPQSEIMRRYLEGKERFAEQWPISAAGIFVGVAILVLVAVYFGLIPWILRGVGKSEAGVRSFRRRLALATALICLAAVLIWLPMRVRGDIRRVNERIAAGETIRKHLYAKVQPDAEHPYTLEHYLLDTFLGHWPYIFRVESWKAAAGNITGNIALSHGIPLLGIGPGNFKVIHPLYASQLERRLLGQEVLARKVRSEWLAVGLECGLLGVLGKLWIFAAIFFAWWLAFRRWRTKVRPGEQFRNREFLSYFLFGSFASLVAGVASATVGIALYQAEAATVIYWVGAAACAMVPVLAASPAAARRFEPEERVESAGEGEKLEFEGEEGYYPQ